jgi:large conductance mechanosensitive channel
MRRRADAHSRARKIYPRRSAVRYHGRDGMRLANPMRFAYSARAHAPRRRRKKHMGIVKEFREFAVKGNVMDLAVGVIIGGAFSTIVNSIVKDLIMPIVGVATGGLDFSNKFIRLGDIPPSFKGNPDSFKDLQTAGVAVFGYGSFITAVINFTILAFIVFGIVKFMNSLRQPKEAAPAEPPPTPEDVLLLREIRDSLKQR